MFNDSQKAASENLAAVSFSQRLGLWQAGLALAACELVLTFPDYGIRGVLLLQALTVFWLFLVWQWRQPERGAWLSRRVTMMLMILAVSAEGVRLAIQPWRFPLELAALLTFRELCLLLTFFIQIPVCLRSLGGASACLILFSSCLTESHLGVFLLLAYSIVAGVWLLSLYWRDVERDLPLESSERLPWMLVGWGWSGVILLVVVLTVGRNVTREVLGELVGSSGGTGRQDTRAKSGVNDGDNLVDAQENATTTGFSESNVFLDTNERTLYDAADDQYGGKLKKKKETQRAINIGSASNVKKEQQNSQHLQRQKEFGMRREGKKPGQKTKNHRPDEQIDALFCVHGPAPVHFKTNVFAEMRDDELIESIPHREDHPLTSGFGGWMRVRGPECLLSGGHVRHQIRTANLKSKQIMVPWGLRSFRMGLINREDFFEMTDLGVLLLEDGIVPDGTTVETEVFVPDPKGFDSIPFSEDTHYALPRYRRSLVPPEVQATWEQTAREWTRDLPRGWRQICAIRDKLQTEYQLSPIEIDESPDLNGDLLTDFLQRTKRGPDYLFATATAALLRELKYPSRIVGGFYANPKNYVPQDGHIYVRNDDVHFWAETCLPDGTWVIVEATPGYEVLGPQPSWTDAAWSAASAIGIWMAAHWGSLAGLMITACCVLVYRLELLDRMLTIWWRCHCTNSLEACVEGTWSLLQYRSDWAGVGRRGSETVSEHLARLGMNENPGNDSGQLRRIFEEWMYLPRSRRRMVTEAREREIREACRRAVAEWSLKRLRGAGLNRRVHSAVSNVVPSGFSAAVSS